MQFLFVGLGKRKTPEPMILGNSGNYSGYPSGVPLQRPTPFNQNYRNQLVQQTNVQAIDAYSPASTIQNFNPPPYTHQQMDSVRSEFIKNQQISHSQNPLKAQVIPEMIDHETQLNAMEPVIMDLRKQILINRGQGVPQTRQQSQINKNILQTPAQYPAQLITREQKLETPKESQFIDLKAQIFQNLAFNLNSDGLVAQQVSQQKLLQLLLEYFIQNEMKSQASPLQKYQSIENSDNKSQEGTPKSNNKVSTSEDADGGPDVQVSDKVMPITKCPHVTRKHYAKNMCSSCYRKYGRSQFASKCPHDDRLLYSMGMCQTCYLSDYHKRRSKQSSKADAIEEEAPDSE